MGATKFSLVTTRGKYLENNNLGTKNNNNERKKKDLTICGSQLSIRI